MLSGICAFDSATSCLQNKLSSLDIISRGYSRFCPYNSFLRLVFKTSADNCYGICIQHTIGIEPIFSTLATCCLTTRLSMRITNSISTIHNEIFLFSPLSVYCPHVLRFTDGCPSYWTMRGVSVKRIGRLLAGLESAVLPLNYTPNIQQVLQLEKHILFLALCMGTAPMNLS